VASMKTNELLDDCGTRRLTDDQMRAVLNVRPAEDRCIDCDRPLRGAFSRPPLRWLTTPIPFDDPIVAMGPWGGPLSA
jgi:hypothetical protein